ncbi:MAG: sensor histidine kinase, partial [Candidatus Aminicenantia bacterium]
VEINMKVIGDSFIHAILRDVTEKEKIEKLILETERWKAMAELSGGIAHNFNNILAIISGRIQLIKSLTNDERINKNIQAIENMIEEGKKITGKIIDFVQSNGKKTHSQLINLNNLILEVIELAKLKWKDISRIEEKFISIKTNLGDIPEIEVNRVELENVFLNIIYNSVEAIEKEGEIEFTTSFKEPYVCVEIKDNGRGISPEVMGKIFDPFFTTKGTIGTGLGLTICYNTVKRQGGDIKVESKEGEGTKIFIYLPYKSLKTRTKI